MSTKNPSKRRTELRRPQPLSVQIADELRRDILFGRLTHEDRIGQERLTERFQTSRMPIRDALQQLVSEGYLVRGRGDVISIVPIDIEDIEDMFRIEGMLVGFAARRACERASDEEIQVMWDTHFAMKAQVDARNYVKAAQTNREFHEVLNHAASAPRLAATIRHVSLRLHREFLIEFPDWIEHSLSDHEEILVAMSNRDGRKVEQLMNAHVSSSGEEVARTLGENLMKAALSHGGNPQEAP